MLSCTIPKKLGNKEVPWEDAQMALRRGKVNSHLRWLERGNWVGKEGNGDEDQVWAEGVMGENCE